MANSREGELLPTQQHLISRRKALYLIAGATAVLATGCTYNKDVPQSTNSAPNQPWDYFPTAIGTKWVYDITLGKDGGKNLDSLVFEDVNWPQINGSVRIQRGRGRLSGSNSDASKTFTLAMSIASKAERQGPLQYPDSVKLKIEKDDLGIFNDAQEVFWAINKKTEGYRVTQVATHRPYTYDPRSSYRDSDGYSLRMLFFGEKPGTNISLGEDSPDSLTYLGAEGSDLRFKRTVKAGDSKTFGELSAGFTEDVWLRKGVGLRRLEQTVNGKTTMTWNLK